MLAVLPYQWGLSVPDTHDILPLPIYSILSNYHSIIRQVLSLGGSAGEGVFGWDLFLGLEQFSELGLLSLCRTGVSYTHRLLVSCCYSSRALLL